MRIEKRVETPLGVIVARAFSVSNSTTAINLKVRNLNTHLGNGMTLDTVIAILLDVSSQDNIKDLVFECELLNSEIKAFPEGGEHLVCLTWENNKWILSVGTEDDEMLHHRLPNVEFPRQPIEYSSSKIQLKAVRIPSTTPASFHFAIAYTSLPLDPKFCSTWYAVDIPHKLARGEV